MNRLLKFVLVTNQALYFASIEHKSILKMFYFQSSLNQILARDLKIQLQVFDIFFLLLSDVRQTQETLKRNKIRKLTPSSSGASSYSLLRSFNNELPKALLRTRLINFSFRSFAVK